MRSAPLLLFIGMVSLSVVLPAQTLPGFSDADYRSTLRENPRVLFYAVSPSMPLSMEGLKEIRSAAEDLRARLVVLVDPAAKAKEIAAIDHPGLRLQRSGELRNLGLQLHYPSVLIADKHNISGTPIAGFKSRQGYVAIVSDRLKLRWKEEFQVVDQIAVPRPMSAFFKPIYGTELILSGNAWPNYLLNLKTNKSFDVPNDDWGDPGASSDGEFVTLLGFDGLSWFSTADILSGKPSRLLRDPGLRTYQSMGQPSAGIHRVLGAVSSSTNPSGLIVHDYERRPRSDGGATVSPLKEWNRVCDGKTIAIPMLSKTGKFLAGTFDGTTRVFRIGADASECVEVFDSKMTSGKADFSIDDRHLVFVSRTEHPDTRAQVDAVFLADVLKQSANPVYYAAPDARLFFPAFMNPDRLVVFNEASRSLITIERTRRILD